jgi:hypothetical protein
MSYDAALSTFPHPACDCRASHPLPDTHWGSNNEGSDLEAAALVYEPTNSRFDTYRSGLYPRPTNASAESIEWEPIIPWTPGASSTSPEEALVGIGVAGAVSALYPTYSVGTNTPVVAFPSFTPYPRARTLVRAYSLPQVDPHFLIPSGRCSTRRRTATQEWNVNQFRGRYTWIDRRLARRASPQIMMDSQQGLGLSPLPQPQITSVCRPELWGTYLLAVL